MPSRLFQAECSSVAVQTEEAPGWPARPQAPQAVRNPRGRSSRWTA